MVEVTVRACYHSSKELSYEHGMSQVTLSELMRTIRRYRKQGSNYFEIIIEENFEASGREKK